MPEIGSHKHEITIEVDESMVGKVTDHQLALWWHVAQANPADGFDSKEPGQLAERIGREIIRRWLGMVPAELHHHQGRHYYWSIARSLGSWKGPDRKFVPHEPVSADLDTVLEALETAADEARLLDPVAVIRFNKARDAIREGRQAQEDAAAQEAGSD